MVGLKLEPFAQSNFSIWNLVGKKQMQTIDIRQFQSGGNELLN